MVLVVGDLAAWVRVGRPIPADGEFRFVSPGQLDAALLAETEPDLILAPLAASSFDVIEIAHRLAELGYRGRFRAVTGPLPSPDMVRREVAEAAPGLDFDLVVIGGRVN